MKKLFTKTMKRWLSRLLSVLVTFICFASQGSVAYATDNNLNNESYENYIMSVLPYYLTRIKKDDTNYYVSDGFDIHMDSDQNNKIYLVFEETECIGEIIVSTINGEFSSSFMQEQKGMLTKLYERKASLSFCIPDSRTLVLYDGAEMSVLGTNTDEDSYTELEVETISSCPREHICLHPVSIDDTIGRSYGSYFGSGVGMLYVPIVGNAPNYNTGEWLYWAASSGSIVSYRNAITPALDPYAVYYAIYYEGITNPSGIHVGNVFQHYNVSYIYIASGTNYNTVASIIASNRPIYAAISDSTGANNHAVVICGYQSAQGGYYFYTLMDPNNTSYVTVSVSYNSNSFNYPSNSGTYTNWQKRYY